MSSKQEKAIGRIVQAMCRTGNQPGIVRQWIDAALKWADEHPGPEGAAVRDWLAYWQSRPFYTATELVPLIPALGVAFEITPSPLPQFSVARLAHMLDYARLPKLKRAGGGTFFRHPYRLQAEEFYIVEQIHQWKNRSLTQEEFINVAFG